VEPATTSLRECMSGFGADASRGIRIVMQCAHETSVKALCKRPTGPLHTIALGDSVMWGQGLGPNKFAREVKYELSLASSPRRVPDPYIFAHSGATLGGHDWDQYPFKPPQEIPLPYPTIPKQLEMAKSWLGEMSIGHDQVALVLLNGGINDVGALEILSIDPTIGPDWVRERTRQKLAFMYNSVEGVGLLPKVLETFPKAKVVIPNYYQIISTDTDITALELLLVAFFPGSPLPLVGPILRNKLDKQSEAFNLEWTESMRRIIEEVRTTRPDLFESDPERICLVDVQFSGINAYGAEDSYLWELVSMNVIDTNDQVREARIRDCADAENHPWGSDKPFYCRYAPAFHPNVTGANRYKDVIMSCIRSTGWIEEWRGGPWTWVLEEMTASMEPPLGKGEDRLNQWTGKISARELQPPHYPVRGTVVIYRNNLEVKRVPTDTEFSWTFARRIIIDKEPYLQDDRVVVQAPYARPFVLLGGGTNPFPE
jgi:hypothetical protein